MENNPKTKIDNNIGIFYEKKFGQLGQPNEKDWCMVLCPFHDDHNPSMGIKNNRYHCFACGEKGDVIEFVMKRECLNFVEAVKRLQ